MDRICKKKFFLYIYNMKYNEKVKKIYTMLDIYYATTRQFANDERACVTVDHVRDKV